MAYHGQLSPHQQIKLVNTHTHTHVTVQSSQGGQQQAQRSSYTTGPWRTPPTLWRTEAGYILRIEAQSPIVLQIQSGGSVALLRELPPLGDATVIGLDLIPDAETLEPMEPMEPMAPMAPMAPMEMRMGNMAMKMGDMALQPMGINPPPPQPMSTHFCPQCGSPVQPSDRFCRACGHNLNP